MARSQSALTVGGLLAGFPDRLGGTSTSSATSDRAASVDQGASERLWEDLLLFIEEGRVVPVIGPELLTVHEGGVDRPLYQALAERLAAWAGLPRDQLPPHCTLNDVVSLHVRRGGERDDLYSRLLQLLRDQPAEPAPAIRALARILPFRLFVTLTFDAQMLTALRLERPGSEPVSVAYSTTGLRDLAAPYESLREPVVFHLLGRASATPEYAICDEDLLEFLHALQDAQRRPVRLFDALRDNHLLILGSGFGDWLARFFLRTARGLELTQKRKRWELLADASAGLDKPLTAFLSSYSLDTKVLPMSAAQFIDELSRRWQAAHPPKMRAPGAEVLASGDAKGEEVSLPAEGMVFISYAREDGDAAGQLADELQAAGLDVWFDRRTLRVGDDWAHAIRRGIETAAVFVPVVSRNSLSEANRRREFWREWNLADREAERTARGERYIVPVLVDEARLDHPALPERFARANAVTLPGGRMTQDFAADLKGIVRAFHRLRRAST